MICNGSEKTFMGDLWPPSFFVIDRSAKIFIHPQRTDKTVRFFVFAQVYLTK